MADEFDKLARWLTDHQSWFKPSVFEVIREEFQNEVDIAEIETLIVDELMELTLLELTSLRHRGWFHSVDIEENDGMLFLMGNVTSKFCEITQSQLSGQISFFAEAGRLQFDNGESIDVSDFKKLIELAEAYYQLSYRRY